MTPPRSPSRASALVEGWASSRIRTPRLLITADAGGSNGASLRLWKIELQKLADETGLSIAVSHLPPGTSKWNKIEHRLFSFISQNWRGKPLISHEVIVNLIAATTTKGLQVHSNWTHAPTRRRQGVRRTARVNLRPDKFQGDWNYQILPTPKRAPNRSLYS